MRKAFFKNFLHIIFSTVILFSVTFLRVYATSGVPTIVSYQGRLADSSGTVLGGAGTNYYFKFSIWDSPTVGSGAKLWPAGAPGTNTLSVASGVFNVNIGDTGAGYPDALTYDFQTNDTVYLQVEVSSDNSIFETLGPRQRITSSGSAINAKTLGGFSPSYFAPLASPTFTGTVTLPAGQVVNGVTLATGGTSSKYLSEDGTYTTPVNSGGTVTSVSVVSANGFAGTVSTATTTPAITLSTTITGLLKGNGTSISAAISGTDYAPATSGSGLLKGNGAGGFSTAISGTDFSAGTSALATGILKSTTGTGALSIAVAGDFPTLNQNTTGSAATLTTPRTINGISFDGSANITITAAAGTLSGSTLNSTVTGSSLTSVGAITSGTWSGLFGAVSGANLTNLTAANISAGTAGINISGNAGTATALQTPRNINGTSFNGTADITVTAAAGTLTGSTLNSSVTSSSLTSVGTIATGTWSGLFGAISGANLTNLTAANISAGTAGINISGNAGTATALQNPRTINGISFDGSANITVTAAAGTLTGSTLNSTVTGSSLTSLGTIATGVWNGTTIAIANGGTNSTTTLNNNRIMQSSGGAIVEAAAITASKLLVSDTNGIPVASALSGIAHLSSGTLTASNVALASEVTGTLPVANGGTNITSYAIGDITYASASTTLTKLADVATGNVLISGGVTTAPSWGKVGLTTHVTGTLPVANGGTGNSSVSANRLMVSASTSSISTNANFTVDLTNNRMGIGGTSSSILNLTQTTSTDTGLTIKKANASTANFLTLRDVSGFHYFDVLSDGSICGGGSSSGCDSSAGTDGYYYNRATNAPIGSNFVNLLSSGDTIWAYQSANTSASNIGIYALGATLDRVANSFPTDTIAKQFLMTTGGTALGLTAQSSLTNMTINADANATTHFGANLDTTPTAQVKIETNSTTFPALLLKGKASQTANIFDVQTSAGTSVLSVSPTSVGIGTSTPSVALDVVGAITSSTTITGQNLVIQGGGSYGAIISSPSSVLDVNSTNDSTQIALSTGTSPGTVRGYLGADTTSAFKVWNASAGNVLLSVNNSSGDTTLKGLILNTTSSTDALMQLLTNGTARSYIGADSSNRFIVYDNTASNAYFKVSSGGNVGIGMTPTIRLDVAAASADTATRVASFYQPGLLTAGTYAFISTGVANSTDNAAAFGFIKNSSGGNSAFMTVAGDDPSASTGLFVRKGGNVGIGTMTPAQLFTVNGGSTLINNNTNGTAKPQIIFNSNGTNYNGIFDAGLTTSNNGLIIGGTTTTGGNATVTGLFVNGNTGAVGVGTTAPGATLEVNGDFLVGSATAGIKTDVNNYITHIGDFNGNSSNSELVVDALSSTAYFSNTFVGIGTGNPSTWLDVSVSTSGGIPAMKLSNNTGGTTQNNVLQILGGNNTGVNASNLISFQRPDATVIGSISQPTAVTVAYNNTSDRRIKENITPTAYGLKDLMKIEVNDFNFISDPNKQRMNGFIAQNLRNVYPDAVTTNGDDGTVTLAKGKNPWMVDYGRITPLLVKSIQDMELEIQTLKDIQPNTFGDYANSFFADVVTGVSDGVAYMKGIVTGTLKVGSPAKRTGVTLYDEVTGDPYCLSIANGATKTTMGECGIITPPAPVQNVTPSAPDNTAPVVLDLPTTNDLPAESSTPETTTDTTPIPPTVSPDTTTP